MRITRSRRGRSNRWSPLRPGLAVAPELKGGVGGDVFALGKVLYELVTGLGPGQFPEIPEELLAADQFRMANDVIACACAPNPRDRYPTALAMAAALRRACTVQPKRVHGGLILGAVMLALAASCSFLGFGRGAKEPSGVNVGLAGCLRYVAYRLRGLLPRCILHIGKRPFRRSQAAV